MNETTYEERLASKNVLKIFSLKFSTWKLSYIFIIADAIRLEDWDIIYECLTVC